MLEVLAVIAERTEGRVWPTSALAQLIVRVRRAVLAIPPWFAYVYARNIQAVDPDNDAENRATALALAMLPWGSEWAGTALEYSVPFPQHRTPEMVFAFLRSDTEKERVARLLQANDEPSE